MNTYKACFVFFYIIFLNQDIVMFNIRLLSSQVLLNSILNKETQTFLSH